MSERFFLPATPRDGRAVLDGDEARHLVRVLRGQVGDAVRVFDGRGGEWFARVTLVGRDRVELAIERSVEPRPAAGGARVTLAVALPKGERQKWLVEKLTELGVERLVPLVTSRGVAEATAAARTRLERGVIEACKQCGRTTLMEIAAPLSIGELAAATPGAVRLLADPAAAPARGWPAATGEIIAAVGPEGGFTSDEAAAAVQQGFVPVSLGPHILRVETAAVALASKLKAW